ncbi:MAG: hypothetical protein GC160_25325 [Acidobacteria bacterium]|nr:hypothetical protein [Acidobacteriota bacterium]
MQRTGSAALLRVATLSLAALAWTAASALQTPTAELHWYKGNLHTHTINSDGDSSPDAVARWYKEHRYHFLALTDHNYFTDPQGLNSFLAAKEKFLLLRGEEVTASVHINAFGLSKTIEPLRLPTIFETLQQNVDHIRAQGAMPSLNHPNFHWAVSQDELARVNNLKLFEVYNGHPTTNEQGGGGSPSLDAMWDHVLGAGKRMWGIAVDDAHSFKQLSPDLSNPGRGWIQVHARELSEKALLDAIDKGDFYASTGVELVSLDRGAGRLSLEIKTRETEKYTVRFLGKGGKTLLETFENPAEYRLKGGEPYVRAQVIDSNGRKAWTQPVFAE